MNRVIKFRGKCIRSGDWIEGDLIHGVGAKHGAIFILPIRVNLAHVKHCDVLDGVQVDPKTVGQFTGLQDKNGNDIYEGDILKYHLPNECDVIYIEPVTFNEGCFELEGCSVYAFCELSEIIGNIYENPELLNQTK